MFRTHQDDAPDLDLRSERSIWEHDAKAPTFARPLDDHARADIVIVGAGITGAFIAERLSRSEQSILVLDRHEPQRASTAASTALLQWEIDAPLIELEQRLGADREQDHHRLSDRSFLISLDKVAKNFSVTLLTSALRKAG